MVWAEVPVTKEIRTHHKVRRGALALLMSPQEGGPCPPVPGKPPLSRPTSPPVTPTHLRGDAEARTIFLELSFPKKDWSTLVGGHQMRSRAHVYEMTHLITPTCWRQVLVYLAMGGPTPMVYNCQ